MSSVSSQVEVPTTEVSRLAKDCIAAIGKARNKKEKEIKSELLETHNWWRKLFFLKPLNELPYKPDGWTEARWIFLYGETETIAERLLKVAGFTTELKMLVSVYELDRLLRWKK